MKLSQVKALLPTLNELTFKLENGSFVPTHFHITEVGAISKHFIDCGGTIRTENKVNFQLWNANDTDHRLAPTKLLSIIQLSEDKLGIKDGEVEVEFQGETIGIYRLAFDGTDFILQNKATACLASDKCGIPEEKLKVQLAELPTQSECCGPNSSCC